MDEEERAKIEELFTHMRHAPARAQLFAFTAAMEMAFEPNLSRYVHDVRLIAESSDAECERFLRAVRDAFRGMSNREVSDRVRARTR